MKIYVLTFKKYLALGLQCKITHQHPLLGTNGSHQLHI